MYVIPDKSAAALAEKLPTLEVLLRLQSEMEKIARFVETREEPEWFGGELTGGSVDKITKEVVDLLSSPLGFELFIEILPSLIRISKRGGKILNTRTNTS